MEKRRKLNVELIKFLIGSMLVVGVLMLLGSSLVNNRQYRKLYNDKALEIAKTVSDQVNGDFIEELCKEIDTEEFEQIQKEAVAADDEQPIIDWLKEKGMYQNYERINEYLHSIQADMNIEYLYIQMIQDHSSVYLFDPSSGYLTLGYKEELSERFDKLKGNERLEPTVSRTEFGWLSSHRQYVGIVVQAGCLCAEAVGAECCTDSFHFVCRDRNADSGSADQDSLITRSVLDRMAYFSGVNRIINCLVAVASEVLIFQSLFVQICFYLLHQLISAVVAS